VARSGLVSFVYTPTIPDMTTTKKMANEDRLRPILDANWQIHRATLERARQVEEHLAAVGIRLGGYRLDPALGGPIRPSEQPLRRRANRSQGCASVGWRNVAGVQRPAESKSDRSSPPIGCGVGGGGDHLNPTDLPHWCTAGRRHSARPGVRHAS